MRRSLTLFIVLLLVAAGVVFYLRQSQISRNPAAAAQSTVHSNSATNATPSAAAAKSAAASAVTNKFAWRLKNTSKPLSELIHDPRAILLENAFIETGSKINLSIPKNLQSQGDPGAYVVQARGPVSSAFRSVLAAAGATIVSYIPNNAYLVRASQAVADALMGSPLVQAVIPYEPYYKVQSSLLSMTAMAQQSLPQDVQLNLGLFADDAADTLQQIQKMGGVIISGENSAAGYPIVKVQPPSDWTAIAALPGVHIVEPYYRRTLANDLARAQMQISAGGTTTTNYFNLYGSNVIVEVNDTGIDTNHPDFSNNHANYRVFYTDPSMGTDTNGHGTHVAGIIAGDGTESITVSNAYGSPMPGSPQQFRGKAPLAQMLSMNFLDSDQQLQQAAAQTNALISNNSWGNGDSDYDLEAASYDAATRDAMPFATGAQPVLFVFAAGDNGNVADSIESPGTAKDVMTVGALEEGRYLTNLVTDASSNVFEAWFSMTDDSNAVWNTSPFTGNASGDGNVGIGTEGTFGRFKPDVVAPGTFVISCRSEQWDTNAYYHPTNNDIHYYSEVIPSNSVSTAPFQFLVPNNAVAVIFNTITNASSPPVLPDMPIYLQTNSAGYGLIGSNFVVFGPNPTILNQDWSVEVSNTTTAPLAYTLVVDIQTTNDWGNYYDVLHNMNDSLGTPNYYRYESGTSMSAPAVSGFLALLQDYFTNQYTPALIPSPALLKALTINGALTTEAQYFPQVNGPINYEGWGLPVMPNTIVPGITNVVGASCSTFFRDQGISNALATGDSETFKVTLNSSDFGNYLPLHVTLAWTDPAGDPVAAIKLVNSMELVVTDLDNPSVVYYGNDIGAGGFNNVESATNTPIIDNINNVQNININPFPPRGTPDADYSITVIGNRVNANAVSEQTNNIVQDYALVVSAGNIEVGQVSNAIESVTDEGVVSNPTDDQFITQAQTNTILLNQTAGANTPLLGTNIVGFTTNTVDYGTNGQFYVGMTNQWHFYVVTNTTGFTNAAFITFGATTLAIPRMGVFANSLANSTTPGADLDLMVTRSSTDGNAANLLNLDPVEISNCLNGVNGDGASLLSGGTDYVAYTNVPPNEVYYIGVKSESQMGVQYSFIPIFTDTPFGSLDQNGDETVNALNAPALIPDGTATKPGYSIVFGIALYPITLQNVIITNDIYDQNFGDLVGSVTHSGISVGLNSHDSIGPGAYQLIYDAEGTNTPGSRPVDGPGTLQSYVGNSGQGVWQFTEENSSLGQTGEVLNTQMFLKKYQNPRNGLFVTVEPGQWFYTYLTIPAGYTNLELFGVDTNSAATGLSPTSPGAMQMYLNTGGDPNQTTYLFEANLTNNQFAPLPPPFPLQPGLWNDISDGPPLQPGTYYIGLYNPGTTAETVYLLAVLNGLSTVVQPSLFTATNTVPIINDAVTSSTNTTIVISNSPAVIASVNVGFVVQYPRISDLAFTLVGPQGQRVLLMENRGGPTATNAGGVFYITNSIGTTTANGSFEPQTNSYNVQSTSGSLSVFFNAYTIPDQLTIYYGNQNDPNTFTPANLLFNSGMMSGTTNITVSFGPGVSTYVTFVVNQFGNTNGGSGDAWTYTINGTFANYNYLTFTDDTNLTDTPIKFAIPPFDLRTLGTNYTFGNLDVASNGDYFGLTNIYDTYGGWTVPSNQVVQVTNGVAFTNNYNEVSVISDPGVAFQSNTNSSNFLALGYGTILRTNFLTPYHLVSVSYQYRGPGIAGWWRGEGDARDSSDAEQRGQNGSLIGRFTFPAGEVSQAFSMQYNGQAYDFAGTNSYVQIRQQPFLEQIVTNSGTNLENSGPVTIQSSYLDVGTGPGFTVEGWINPTNLTYQQPLVEWLARVPTNGSDTNLTIRAGPFLDRATSHYYYMLGPTNWTTSETWAEQIGGHLVTIDSANEQNWVYDTFANYGGRNHNLWIGLTNLFQTFAYSSGLTNIAYTNWLFGDPTNCDGTRNYTFMFSPTNAYPGTWALANDDGIMCGPVTNIIYGVVEVTNIQTNGVQFWVSITNVPGTTNLLTTNTGCLFANLVDITNGSHWICSPAGLVQSNIFQHVALTYDTNSGIASLFYDGTNVATTNWGVSIVPKTTGDVLLGKDMSLETNNYYGGLMDEMSIYNRALSDAEIQAIYSVSAYTTNRLIGKFDPTITPPLSLAEAQVVLGNMTNTILGDNNTWQQGSFTFIPQTNMFPLQVQGIQPGMLFDSFAVDEAPVGNLYYLPEQSLEELNGQSPNGAWTLEIWNTRLNALATNADLLSWQLQMILQSNTPPPLTVNSQQPTGVTILPGEIVTLAVPVPIWATVATNILVSSTEPLNVYYNPTNAPTGTPPDYVLPGFPTAPLPQSGSDTLFTNTPLPDIVPGATYYIGLQNTGPHAASAVFEVNFNITDLTNDVPFSDTVTNGSLRYYSFDVTSSNAYEATFQLLHMNGNADLVVSKGALPTLTNSDYGSFNSGDADENIYVLTNSMPVPLTNGIWYIGVINRDTHPVSYTVLAQELDLNPASIVNTNYTVIPLTNGVPFDYTAGPGAALTNFFSFVVTNTVTNTAAGLVTNHVGSIHFELYNLTGNGNLTVQTDAPPFAPPFFQSSDQPSTGPEYIQIGTNSALTNLTATWYLGVPNYNTNLIHFTIIAVIDTNNVFPAFPGAEGAGAGTPGASFRNGYTNNAVYHVTTLADSGPGTLRDAVSSTNRTIVFDISGVIYLQTPLVITNPYLTIEGQTAPEGGITVAGATATVSTHDVVIRYVRFRPVYSGQNLFVTLASGGNVVNKISPGIQSQTVFANTGLVVPEGLVFNTNGDLFVGNSDNEGGPGNIVEYLPSGAQTATYASGVDAHGLAFNSAGDLFEADYANSSVNEFTPPPAFSQSVYAASVPESDLTFDKYGDLFVTGGNQVTEIGPNGTQRVFAKVPTPHGIAFNREGDMFVSGGSGPPGIVYKFKPNGVSSVFANMPGVAGINGIVFDNADDLFVVAGAGGTGNIVEIRPDGTQITGVTESHYPDDLTFGVPVAGLATGLGGDALQFNIASNVIADHISALWSSNDDLSILNSSNVTVQWSILSDCISNQPAPNGAFVRYGGGTVSLHHNLFADNQTGSPRLGDNVSLDFVNNVIYNWVTNAGFSSSNDIVDNPNGFTNYLNYICNYLIAGTNTITTNIAFWSGTTNTWLFQTNNFIDSDQDAVLNGANAKWDMFTNWGTFTNFYTATNQFRLPPVTVDEAYQAYEKVLDFAGVSMFKREPAESNIVEHVRKQAGAVVTVPGLVPTESTNLIFQYSAQDGIPDFWKITYGQVITNDYNNYQPDASGYSELEEFDNWLGAPHALTYTNMPVGVDLQKLFGKTGDLSFFLTNAIHGTVYLTNVLGSYTNTGVYSNTIAIFTPTNGPGGTNYYGFASFGVYVTNNDTVGYFGPVTVNVFVSAVIPTYSEQEGYLPLYEPVTNNVPPNTIEWYTITVPTNAIQATNILLTAGAPVNMWYSTNMPPTFVYPSDFEMLKAATNGSAIINLSGAPLPPVLVPGGTYYLGIQNTNSFATNYAVQVNFETITIPPGIIIIGPGDPQTNILPASVTSPGAASPGGGPYVSTNNEIAFLIFVPPNATSATNTLLFSLNGATSMWFNSNSVPGFGSSPGDVELIPSYSNTVPTNIVLTLAGGNGYPSLIPGEVYYIGLENISANTITNAFEYTFGLSYTPPILPPVTNVDIVAGNTLNVNDQATDTNAGTLVYYLTTAPDQTNATISSTGQISWTVPTNAPGENVLFTTIVSNSFTMMTATNQFTVTVLPLVSSGVPLQTNSVASNSVNWIAVSVPVDAQWATNILVYATNLPVNVLFTTNFQPTVVGAYTLITNQTSGISILGTATVPTNIVPGTVYYLGVQNNNSVAVGYALQVNFGYYPPPVLPAISNQVITAGQTLTVTNTATNSAGVGSLFYTLTTSPPVGATISTGGIIDWVTASNQAPGEYLFTTIVTNSVTTLSATNAFTVTVLSPSIGQGPQTNTIAGNSIGWLTVNVPANAISADNILLFAKNLPVNLLYTTNYPPTTNGADVLLSNVTRGSSILVTNMATAPTNLVPGGTYYLGVQNTNNAPVTYALQVIFGFPAPPVPVSIVYTNIGGTNGYLLTWFAATNDYFKIQETPQIISPVWNTFTNIISYTGPVTATNGLFSFFDNGSQYPFGPMRFYRLLLLEANGLTLPIQSNFVLSVSEPLIVTNTAFDSDPLAMLTYNLSDFPAPSTSPSITTNGVITWTPGPADAGNAFTFTTSVSDNGLPPAHATNAFTVFVLPAPVITSATATPSRVNIQWTASTNDLFQVEWTTNLVSGSWTLLPQVISSANGSFTYTDNNPSNTMKFYRLVWVPPP